MKNIFVTTLLLIFSIGWLQAQDTTKTTTQKGGFLSMFEEPAGLYPSPRRAMLLSLAFPGAGQVYNKKLWYIRAPIATGAVAGGVVFYITTRQNYLLYRNAVRDRNNGIETEFDSNPSATTPALRAVRDDNRKLMEQALFGTIIVYLLNGVEAFTTAHLLNFDVSDDLSFKLEPTLQNTYQGNSALGFGISISPNYTSPQPVRFSLY